MKKDFDLKIGLRIRKIREALHMTREQFSESCEISESFLSAIEGGRKGITVKTLCKICNAVHVTPNYIIYGDDKTMSRDMVIEMVGSLKEREQTYALHMLASYVMSVHELEQDETEALEELHVLEEEVFAEDEEEMDEE